MRAGQLRHRVTIQTPTQGNPTASGQVSDVWADLAEVWSKKQWTGGRETYRAAQVVPDASVVYTIRYRSDIDAKMRIKDGSDYYYIGAVLPDDRENEFLQLPCTVQP